jgi:hypothetical protein
MRTECQCTSSLLFPHGELDWHLAVRYQGDATSHNKTELHVLILQHKDSTSIPMDSHCSSAQKTQMLKMLVPVLFVTPGARKLLLFVFQFIIHMNVVIMNTT